MGDIGEVANRNGGGGEGGFKPLHIMIGILVVIYRRLIVLGISKYIMIIFDYKFLCMLVISVKIPDEGSFLNILMLLGWLIG